MASARCNRWKIGNRAKSGLGHWCSRKCNCYFRKGLSINFYPNTMKNEQAITVFAKWRVKEGQLDAVLNLLTEVVKKSTGEEGNLFYKVHQSNSDVNTLILFEGYKDEAALAAHRDSEHFQTVVVGKIVPLLEEREVILTNQLVFD